MIQPPQLIICLTENNVSLKFILENDFYKSNKKIGMKFLVIEGVDGSGKSTQIELIKQYFELKEIRYRYVHFPRTETGIYGDLVARFLRGDFGSLSAVDPYLVALIYAGDRKDAADQIRQWLQQGYTVLLDRYVYSNIAFQCAKVEGMDKQQELRDWILNLEYGYHQIPKPDINILLNVPFSFTQKKLTAGREGAERNYLQGMADIHEADLDFQKRVRDMYLWQAETCPDLKIIDCVDHSGGMRSPDHISQQIIDLMNISQS
jgi:dTMP kinase